MDASSFGGAVMPRALSEDTEYIYSWLWGLPWAAAADIVRITGLKQNQVSNALKRGERRGWLRSTRLGREFKPADRYVFENAGLDEMIKRYGLVPCWWHAAKGVRALARRLEVLELAYRYLPGFWTSNAVSRHSIWVYSDVLADTDPGDSARRQMRLVEINWFDARLLDLQWQEKGPVEAIATYTNGYTSNDLLRLPVLWRGNFQKARDIHFVRGDMEKVLVQDERWWRLPQAQVVSGPHYPGMVIFTPDRVSAAMVKRHYWEGRATDSGTGATAAIMDARGQVVQAMMPPTAYWSDVLLPAVAGDLQDIGATVDSLGRGAYAAVNGMRAWKTFRALDGSPGVTKEQVAASVGMDTTVADRLLERMVRTKVISVKRGDPGYYLDVSGRGLLADSQRRSRSGVKRRWGVYQLKDGEYTRAQSAHNRGQADAILALRAHGYDAFPTMGLVIDHRHGGRLFRVTPDAFVIIPPGVLVAIEFERTAKTPKQLLQKAAKYQRLMEVGFPIPVLFIMDTDPGRGKRKLTEEEREAKSEAAARTLAELRHPYLLATTLQAVQRGPHGESIWQDGVFRSGADSGCWWYWYEDGDAPDSNAPIDGCSQLYYHRNHSAWLVPLDNPYRLLHSPEWRR